MDAIRPGSPLAKLRATGLQGGALDFQEIRAADDLAGFAAVRNGLRIGSIEFDRTNSGGLRITLIEVPLQTERRGGVGSALVARMVRECSDAPFIEGGLSRINMQVILEEMFAGAPLFDAVRRTPFVRCATHCGFLVDPKNVSAIQRVGALPHVHVRATRVPSGNDSIQYVAPEPRASSAAGGQSAQRGLRVSVRGAENVAAYLARHPKATKLLVAMSDDDTALFCGRLVAAQEPKMDALKATRSYLTLRALGFSEILNKETRLHFDAKFRPHLTLAVSKPSS